MQHGIHIARESEVDLEARSSTLVDPAARHVEPAHMPVLCRNPIKGGVSALVHHLKSSNSSHGSLKITPAVALHLERRIVRIPHGDCERYGCGLFSRDSGQALTGRQPAVARDDGGQTVPHGVALSVVGR